jgi:hypothetical protein
MHPEMTQQLAAQHIAELHQQAARQRLVRELRARPGRATRRRRGVRVRLWFRRPRPTMA